MAAFAAVLATGLAVVLIVAASRKFIDATALGETLQRLGLSSTAAPIAARLAPMGECLCALLLIFGTGRWFGAAAGVLPGLAMVTVGIKGVLAPTPIPCACFSAHSSHPLGKRQVVVGSCFALAALAAWTLGTPLEPQEAAVIGVSVAFLVSVANIVAAWPSIRTSYLARTSTGRG